ncbi:hypothetical protein C7N43_28030, partial [Sphingobacteriales bacterium UPWRP_1]
LQPYFKNNPIDLNRNVALAHSDGYTFRQAGKSNPIKILAKAIMNLHFNCSPDKSGGNSNYGLPPNGYR